MKKPLLTCLSAAAVFALTTVCAADDPPPCDKNHYILNLPCKVQATDAAIGPPSMVTTDPSGNVYFSGSSVVFRIDAEGWLIRVAGNGNARLLRRWRPGHQGVAQLPGDVSRAGAPAD